MADELASFMQTYCVACHGESKQKGDRRVDHLAMPPRDSDAILEWRDVLDQLTLGEMPPRAAKQPSDELRTQTIEAIRQSLEKAQAEQQSTHGQSVLRRLNRFEYLNTLRDLFKIEMAMFDPTTKFPRDQTVQQLDNVGDTLVTSAYLMQQYLFAADQVIEKVFATDERPAEQTWTFRDRFRQQPEVDTAHRHAFENRYMCLYECPQSERPEGAFGPLHEFHEGVPVDGMYEVRVRVEAKNRITPYHSKDTRVVPEDPMRIGVIPGNARLGPLHVGQPFQTVLAEAVLPDEKLEWVTFRVWLDQGFAPRFTFPNGMIDIRAAYARLVRNYNDLLPEEARDAKGIVENRIALFKHGHLPHLRIHEVTIRGPLADSPPLPHRHLLPNGFQEDRVREHLAGFATRAYRRPVSDDEVDRLMMVFERRRGDGLSPLEAYQDALKSALCSAGFLYLDQSIDPETNELSPHALASRLSYFLWSSMPDDELRALADAGTLLENEVLQQQVRRMLADPRSNDFVVRFLDSWLNLRDLGGMPPDRESFEKYYSQNLQESMRRETFLFMRHLLDDNLSILRFLTADYSFINRPLARLYGVPDLVPVEAGHLFHRVQFSDRNRGGLLGQGSVLTVTANGIETSPVLRGVWLLNNILGTPPPAPPEDVPAIDPDVRGATSIRDLLIKHRESPACFDCHEKIDPLGFALENFDPIGQWRTEYEKGTQIDASGVLPSGESFQDLAGLKEVLRQRQDFFARMLTERLVSYACGRRIEPIDRVAISPIYEELRSAEYPMRTLIERLVVSDIFRRK